MTTLECPKCAGRMDEGYLLDNSDKGAAPLQWISDPPERRWWGIRLKGHAQLQVRSFRCRSCGYLESYAPKPL